jgi:hypothetical protein
MKAKTINKILTGKFIAWTKSIEDEAVRKQVEENSIITGGSIVSLLLNEEVSDFDVYFRTPEAAYAVAQYYVKKLLENPPPTFKDTPEHKVEIYAKLEPAISEGKEDSRIGGTVKGPAPARVRVVVKSAGVAGAESKQTDYQYFEGLGTDQSAAVATDEYVSNALGQPEGYAEGQVGDTSEPDSNIARSYTDNVAELDDVPAEELLKDGVKPEGGKRTKFRVLFVTSNAITLSDQMQLVLRFQGEVDEIHKNYDFVHCTSSWTSWDKRLTLCPEALEAILTKELKYIGSKYPICSLIRTRKFITRGWTINAGQYVKMAYQVSKLDLDSASVLEDQLVGVDSAYFNQLINELREKASGDRVDATYLMTLIDKIF